MIYTINEIRNKTVPIARKYGVAKMSLFGSYAREETTADSDIDLCIEKGKLNSLFKYYAFVDELEQILCRHVDVVTTGAEDKQFLSDIQKDAVLLYAEEADYYDSDIMLQ